MKGFNDFDTRKKMLLEDWWTFVSSFALFGLTQLGKKKFLRCLTIGKYKLHKAKLSIS